MNFELKAVGTLWIAGQVNPENFGEWGFIGVFTTEKRAKAACTSTFCFVAPIEINKVKDPSTSSEWPGAYRVSKKAKSAINTKYC